MTIQRQYSLPNCTLVLEGLNADAAASDGLHSVMSMVTKVEYYVAGQEKPLSGGRDFLNSLVAAVSDYAQEFLSNLPRPASYRHQLNADRLVALERLNSSTHRLTVKQAADSDVAANIAPQQVDLSTVQLFDLVEAIDQFLADALTLPEMTLNLSPLPKRYVTAREPVGKQAVPAAIGVSSLAVAAIALFFIPIPAVRRPEPAPNTNSQTNSQTAASPTPIAAASPGSSPNPSPTESAPAEASASPTASPTAEASPVSSPAATTANAATNPDVETILNTRPEITNPTDLERLQVALYDRLDQSWKTTPTFSEELIYRVGVSSTGEVLGFKFANDPALNYVNETPLLDLRYTPSEANLQSSIAQFRVVFKPDGKLEVSPWYGAPTSPSPLP
ncbi:MAG TPA: DUF4335 domain-containing protein [Trichocoleus sp.]|jgi:cytoskeletal protein RodZ